MTAPPPRPQGNLRCEDLDGETSRASPEQELRALAHELIEARAQRDVALRLVDRMETELHDQGVELADALHRIAVLEAKPLEMVEPEEDRMKEQTENMEQLAKAAFDAYNAHAGGKTWDGKPTPPWEQLGDAVRGHWMAAVQRIVSSTESVRIAQMTHDRDFHCTRANEAEDALKQVRNDNDRLVELSTDQGRSIAAMHEALKETELARDKHFGMAEEARKEAESMRATVEHALARIQALEAEKSAVLMALAKGRGDFDGGVDGPAYNAGRREGHADVAAKLRAILDPTDAEHLNIDGLLAKVGGPKSERDLMAILDRTPGVGARNHGDDSESAADLERARAEAKASKAGGSKEPDRITCGCEKPGCDGCYPER